MFCIAYGFTSHIMVRVKCTRHTLWNIPPVSQESASDRWIPTPRTCTEMPNVFLFHAIFMRHDIDYIIQTRSSHSSLSFATGVSVSIARNDLKWMCTFSCLLKYNTQHITGKVITIRRVHAAPHVTEYDIPCIGSTASTGQTLWWLLDSDSAL